MKMEADVVIVGTGVGGLFSALSLPRDRKIIMITKSDLESSDSFLAQGGICMLHDKDDYDSYFEDTMKAGHYENRKESVDLMIRSSREIIHDLIGYGVDFQNRRQMSLEMKSQTTVMKRQRFRIFMHLLVREHIHVREFCFMQILQEKKSQVNCLHR